MAKQQCYVFAVTSKRPDFIGVLKGDTDVELILERPFIVEYNNFVPVFSTEFMPLGKQPNYEDAFIVRVPKSTILYSVYMNDTHELVKDYLAKVEEARKNPEVVEEEAVGVVS